MGPTTSHQPKPSLRKVSFGTQSQRPALKKKVTSPIGPSLLGSFREVSHEVIEPPKPDMAASFLQFCAMCEKQIMTPCNNILYCSELCRRKDGCKPLSAAMLSELTPPPSTPSSPSKTILLARTPTGSYTDLPSARIPPKLHHHRPNLDPTEWKPKLRGNQRMQSEAFHYLSQFHRSTMSASSTTTTTSDLIDGGYTHGADLASTAPAHFIGGGAAATETVTSTSVPGLTMSISGTPATTISDMSAEINSMHEHQNTNTYTGSYDFNTRPLPTRHNRWYSVSGATPTGTDLVTPHLAPPVMCVGSGPDSLEESGEDLWGKKVVIKNASVNGSMGALFGKK